MVYLLSKVILLVIIIPPMDILLSKIILPVRIIPRMDIILSSITQDLEILLLVIVLDSLSLQVHPI